MYPEPSSALVWELSGDEDNEELRQLRSETARALEHAHAPLRIACLLLVGVIYIVPLLFLRDQLLEVYAGMNELRAKLGMFILLGISTLVALPLVGYLAHLHAEAHALAGGAQRFLGIVTPSARPSYVKLVFSTPSGTNELLLKTTGNLGVGAAVPVYASPEDSSLAVADLSTKSSRRLVVTQIS